MTSPDQKTTGTLRRPLPCLSKCCGNLGCFQVNKQCPDWDRTGYLKIRRNSSEYNVYFSISFCSATIITFIYKTYDIFLLLPASLHIKVYVLRNFKTRQPTRGGMHYYLGGGKKSLYYFLDKVESAMTFMPLV